MKKKILITIIVISVIAILLIIGAALYIAENGYLYIGMDWQSTPEAALAASADNGDLERLQILTIKKLLNTVPMPGKNVVDMTFVSMNDTLVTVSFVTDKRGLYHVFGYTEEELLDAPDSFVLNGDYDQFIMFPFSRCGTTVFGWCYSGLRFTVNGRTPVYQTYEFECQGKTWSLDYWQIENMPEDEELELIYTEEK